MIAGQIVANLTLNTNMWSKGIHSAVGDMNRFRQFSLRSITEVGKVIGGAMLGITAATALMAKNLASQGISMNATLETATLQFENLMGSAEAAADHIRVLFDFAKFTPFETAPIIQASRMLQAFGGTAFNTTENLALIGDAAAATNAPIEALGFWVGRAYSMIQGGQPFGRAALRLQELAVLSPRARMEIERLQEAGAGASEIWRILEGDLKRFEGAMVRQARTWDGLKATLTDAIDLAAADVFKPLFDSLKRLLEVVVDFTAINSSVFEDWIARAASAIGKGSEIIDDFTDKFEDFLMTLSGESLADFNVFAKLRDILGDILPLVAGLSVSFMTLAGNNLPLVGRVIPKIQPLVGILGALILNSDALRDSFMSFALSVGNAFQQIGPQIKAFLEALVASVEELGPKFFEVGENIVDALAPVVATGLEIATNLIGPFTNLVGVFLDLAVALSEVEPLVRAVGIAFATYFTAKKISAIDFSLKGLATTLGGKLNPALLGISVIVGGSFWLAGLAGGMTKAEENAEALTQTLVGQRGELIKTEEAWKSYIEASSFGNRNQLDDLEKLGLSFGDIKGFVNEGEDGLIRFANTLLSTGEITIPVWDASTDSTEKYITSLDGLVRGGDAWQDSMGRGIDGNVELLSSMQEVIGAYNFMSELRTREVSQNELLNEGQQKLIQSIIENAEATGNWGQAWEAASQILSETPTEEQWQHMQRLMESTKEAAAAIQEYSTLADVFAKVNGPEMTQELLAIRDALSSTDYLSWSNGLSNAMMDAVGALQTLSATENQTFEEFTAAMEKNLQDLLAWKDNLIKIAEEGHAGLAIELAKMGPSAAGLVAQAVDKSDKELDKLEGLFAASAEAAGTAAADKLAFKLEALEAIAETSGHNTIQAWAEEIGAADDEIASIMDASAEEMRIGMLILAERALTGGRATAEQIALGIGESVDTVRAIADELEIELERPIDVNVSTTKAVDEFLRFSGFVQSNPIRSSVSATVDYNTLDSSIRAVINRPRTINVSVVETVSRVRIGGGGSHLSADGNIFRGFNFAHGGLFENHVAQIAPKSNSLRIWAEPETGGEAYIPLSISKRARSMRILATVAREFGMMLSPLSNISLANGGILGRLNLSGLHSGSASIIYIQPMWKIDIHDAHDPDRIVTVLKDEARKGNITELLAPETKIVDFAS